MWEFEGYTWATRAERCRSDMFLLLFELVQGTSTLFFSLLVNGAT